MGEQQENYYDEYTQAILSEYGLENREKDIKKDIQELKWWLSIWFIIILVIILSLLSYKVLKPR